MKNFLFSKGIFRRSLSFLLAFVLLLSCLPVFAQVADAVAQASSQEVQELFSDRSYGQHPRLLADSDDFDRVRKLIDTDPYMMHWYERLYQNASAALTADLPVYELPAGDRQLTIARKVTDRVVNMAFVYQITGDRRFADRAVAELLAVSKFPDWRASEYLDLAQMAYGVAVGYDWLYNYMTEAQRNTVRDALYNYAVLPTMTTNINFWYKTSHGNLNTWCNGALVMAALAIMDDYPEESAALVAEAVTNVQISIATWLPMGSYFEAVSYYGPGICYLLQMIEAMNDTLGTDFGLSQVDGMKDVANYLTIMNTGNNCFNYGDCSGAVIMSPSVYWFAKEFNMPELAVYERSHQHTTISTEDDYLALLWYDPELVADYDRSEDITDHLIYSDCYSTVATFRSAAEDDLLLFAGIKSGSNNFAGHTDMDIGTFVLEAMGERWFDDLGSDSYGLPGYFVPTKETSQRWTYYRKRTEGQNTLVINPTELGGQNLQANCQMDEYESGYNGGYATMDMTEAYSTYGASSVERGMMLFDNRSRILLRDEITCNSASEIYWFAHTKAAITISADGKTAELTLKDKTLLAQIASPSNASFTVMAASPLPTSPNPSGQSTNSDYKKLTIHLTGVTSADISVVFTPIMEESDRNKSLPSVSIAEFSQLLLSYDPATTLQVSEAGEYEIYTADDLMLFSQMVRSGNSFSGKTVKLMNDIDLENRTFLPIGGYAVSAGGTGSKRFSGTFDGQNHVIKNLMIYEQDYFYVALFGSVKDAVIKNVGIENGYVFGSGRVAGLVAQCYGSTVTGCFNKAKVIGTYGQAGGLIGRVDGTSTVSDCYNNAIVDNEGSISGGIVGYVAENAVLTVSNCYHTGELRDSQGSCGLIGYYPLNPSGTGTSITVTNCYATDYIRGSTTSERDYVTITDSQVIGKDDLVSAAISLGEGFMDDCGWENDGYPVFKWQCKTTLPEDGVITTAAQLRLVAYLVNSGAESFSGKTLRLGKNIDLQHRQWVPIGGNMTTLSGGKSFKGTFDGQGHYVKNLKISGDRYYVGFFGNASGEIRNFGIQSGTVSAYRIGGALTGNFGGTMTNCYNLADVECDIAAGGLAGMMAKSTVTNCYNGGDVSSASYSYAGGICAYFAGASNGSLIQNSYNYGAISGKNRGGIVGIVSSSATDLSFENCYTVDSVGLTDESASQFVLGGGALAEADLRNAKTLLGAAFTHDSYYVKNSGYPVLAVFSYKKGVSTQIPTNAQGEYLISNEDELRALAYQVNVLGDTFAGKTIRLKADLNLQDVEWVPIGGSMPTNTSGTYFSGTFQGEGHKIYNLVITTGNCYTGLFGHVNNAGIYNLGVESGCILGMRSAAGIAGWSTNRSKIEGCYNKANVSGIAGIGGIVGMMGTGSSVKNCYNMGVISGPDSAAGLVGYVAGNTSSISISNSYNAGTLAAGLMGSVNSTASKITMTNCYTVDSVAMVNTQAAMTMSDCAALSKDELLLAAATLGSAFAEDYFTQNNIYPVLAWENQGKSISFESFGGNYLIQSADDLRLLSYLVRKGETFAGKTFVITADIDLENRPFFPIGGTDGTNTYIFSGTVEGAGHRILNLFASNRFCTSQYIALFGYTKNAVIRNLGIESGMVCNYKELAGGFVAMANSTTIENCYNKATVRNHAGGVASFMGRAVGTCKIKNCYTITAIAGGASSVGGLVGYTGTDITKLTIENCYTNCDFYITGQSGCGTFMGFISAGVSNSKLQLINSCFAGRTNATSNRVSVAHRKLISPEYYTQDELKQAASYLGSAYAADSKGINGGFPVLAWENASSCSHDNLVVEKNADGTHSYLCKTCGAYETEQHNYVLQETVTPTCTAAGYSKYVCDLCRDSYNGDETPKTGHSYDTGAMTSAPTLDKEGIMSYTCLNGCGTSYEESLKKLPRYLLFDFGNSKAEQEKYNNYAYGFVNFDQASKWYYTEKRVSAVTLDEKEEALVVHVQGEQDSSLSQMAAYVDVSKSGTSSDQPLHYDPSMAEVYQIRLKMENLTNNGSAYVDLHLAGKNGGASVTPNAPNQGLGKSLLNSGKYVTITVSLGDTFASCTELTHIRAYFGNMKSISSDTPGKITIDYIYVGPRAEMPTKQYTVTFVDEAGNVLDTRVVHAGETAVYGGKTPTKAYDGEYHYSFAGWSESLENVTSDMTVKVQFTAEKHKLSYTSVDKESHKESCSCGYTATTAHAWDKGSITKAATCTAEGEVTFTCATCSGQKTEAIASLGHSYEEVVTAPNCTEAGFTTYTCSVCGDSYVGNEVAALGHSYVYINNGEDHTVTCANACGYEATEDHSYVDGVCVCGAEEVTGPVVDHNISFGSQLVLASDLTMTFRMKPEQLTNYDLSTMYIVVERDIYGTDGTMAVDTQILTEYTTGNRLVFTYSGIAAAQMNDEIRAVLHIQDKNGKEYVSDVFVTSVTSYLDLLIASSTNDAKLMTLILDMLNYGTAAQMYFKRHADAPANLAYESFITYADCASVDLSKALENLKSTSSNEGATGTMSIGLDLGTRIGIQYKVALPEGMNAADAVLVISDASGKTLESIDLSTGTMDSKGRYVVNFYGLASRQIRDVVTATAYVNGKPVTATYTYNISTYAYEVANAAGMPENLINLTRLMVIYGDSAAAYFG